MRKAEAEVRRTQDMEVSLLVKSFFEAPVEAVLQRMAGAGGRRPSVAEAREVARRARAAGERQGSAAACEPRLARAPLQNRAGPCDTTLPGPSRKAASP